MRRNHAHRAFRSLWTAGSALLAATALTGCSLLFTDGASTASQLVDEIRALRGAMVPNDQIDNRRSEGLASGEELIVRWPVSELSGRTQTALDPPERTERRFTDVKAAG